MIARLFIILPFSVMIPDGEQFKIYEYMDDGYKIRFYPLQKSAETAEQFKRNELRINGMPAFQANTLRIDFLKDDFERTVESECDPSYSFIRKTVNSFLLKLRFVTHGSKIRPIDFPTASWHLQYLNDDESKPKEEKGLIRGRGGRKFQFSWIALNNEIWDNLNKLSPDYVPPQWDSLLLDADSSLPEVGPSIVLASTALEVFISHILNELARDSSIPSDLWKWINSRQFWLKDPDTSEQFDKLLKILLGTSLKENNILWEAFKNLKNARNSFVHQGAASIGNKPVSDVDARNLVIKAIEIIKFIKDKLPEELQWPEFKHSLKVEFIKKLM